MGLPNGAVRPAAHWHDPASRGTEESRAGSPRLSDGLLYAPADVGQIVAHIRSTEIPGRALAWFRRLLLLEDSYRQRDVLALDGDVIRKALTAGATAPLGELARIADASRRGHRAATAFAAACILVSGRLGDTRSPDTTAAYRSRDYDYGKSLALLAEDLVPDSLFDAQILILEKSYLAALLRTAGYRELAARIGRQVASLGRRATRHADGNRYRAFTDRWTFAIGHSVVLAYLAKAQAAGLTEQRGMRVWKGHVANDYLLSLVAELSGNFGFVKPFTSLGDLHSVNHPEWFDGAYRNYFDTCGAIADQLGDEAGAILPRPARSEPALRRFFEAWGLGAADRIVTLHCREASFKEDQQHDLRNVDIASCLPAARMLAERGFKIIRLGDRSMTPLPPMPGVVDYALRAEKSRELDILLPGIAEFHIGTSSGLSLVPLMFGTPCLYLNWYPFDMLPWGRANWTVLRPLLDARDGRPMPDPAELMASGALGDHALLRANGIEPGALTKAQISRIVALFADSLATQSTPPDRAGRNIGRVLTVSRGDPPGAFVDLPGDLLVSGR